MKCNTVEERFNSFYQWWREIVKGRLLRNREIQNIKAKI